MLRVLAGIDYARHGYVAIVRRLARISMIGIVIVIGTLAASALLFSRVPQGVLPEEDQGAFSATLRLPEGASIVRTAEVVKQVEERVRRISRVQGVLSVVGFNFID